MTKLAEKRGLGRGLSALMADINFNDIPEKINNNNELNKKIETLPIEKIYANPHQPRRSFSEESLDDLASSVRQKGILQPLIVRPKDNGTYEIIAGERRWRAAQKAQLHEVPVIVRDYNDTEVLEIAIIENIQRADLNSIEEALAFRQLMDRFGHTQERLAEELSKSRSYIANLLRLLTLPQTVQDMVRDGKLTAGHARALITLDNPEQIAQKIISGGLSVRETEEMVKNKDGKRKITDKSQKQPEKDADTRALEQDLSANLNMVVKIDHLSATGGGIVTLKYTTLEDLDVICRLLSAGN